MVWANSDLILDGVWQKAECEEGRIQVDSQQIRGTTFFFFPCQAVAVTCLKKQKTKMEERSENSEVSENATIKK